MRAIHDRIADVRKVLAAAQAVFLGRATIATDIAQTTGLSVEGVELAFTEHLEHSATDSELAALVAYAGDAERVLVILSANVFVAALRAIAIARAASERVVVRPSRRDPLFARALIAAANDPSLVLAEDAGSRPSASAASDGLRGEPESLVSGEIHIYGRDETILDVRARAAPGVRVRGHGAGMGAAWISKSANLDESARALTMDVVAFDQRGCLSPRVALVEGDADRADAFAEATHRALLEKSAQIPRGTLPRDERAQVARYVAVMQFAGGVRQSADHVVGTAMPGAPLIVPPAARCVHVAPALDADHAHALLAPLASFLVAVGTDDMPRVASLAPAHARISPLGRMQRPPLDGPVDRR